MSWFSDFVDSIRDAFGGGSDSIKQSTAAAIARHSFSPAAASVDHDGAASARRCQAACSHARHASVWYF
jgi:hypothetical protein